MRVDVQNLYLIRNYIRSEPRCTDALLYTISYNPAVNIGNACNKQQQPRDSSKAVQSPTIKLHKLSKKYVRADDGECIEAIKFFIRNIWRSGNAFALCVRVCSVRVNKL